MVSTKTIEKLQLKIKKNKKPKTIQIEVDESSYQDNKVIMDGHYIVLFSIHKRYFDNVWCDVLYMDLCHLLLARS